MHKHSEVVTLWSLRSQSSLTIIGKRVTIRLQTIFWSLRSMIYTIAAIYGNGGALPLEPLNLSEETRLKIVPEEAGDETQEASLPDLADGSARGV